MSNERSKGNVKILSGTCPDKRCRSKLYFPSFDSSVECTRCGQRHERSALHNVQEVSAMDTRWNDRVRNILLSNIIPKHGTEMVKVLGLSNYHCKLLSPLLTKYGMDKRTGKAELLADMNQGDIFDCGLFGDRAFLIDPEHIPVAGFGRDVTGSMNYLSQTLDLIKRVNGDEERLVPLHADGDGHCLVHAISRALVGRELFWHPLRCSLKKHFKDNLRIYKELFKDFVDEDDWKYIIDECDPDFVPLDGELLGLRNIHVFGLANVLKRPIILLDSLECMNSLGDYAALFLPSLVQPNLCRGKDNKLNKPLCIAWSSPGHNHYIPLVGIKKKPLPVLPVGLLPKAWGVPQSQIFQYMDFQDGNYCTIGGDRNLGDPYILRLVSAMEKLFLEKFGVHPALVADVHHYLFQSTGVVSADREMVTLSTKKAVEEKRLYRCLDCDAICEVVIKSQWFSPGGILYNMALFQNGSFVHNQYYSFPLHGIVCRYNGDTGELVPDSSRSTMENCTWCNSSSTLRNVMADGSTMYKNEDKTKTPSNSTTCGCGFKHYWDGKEYDNPPQKLNVTLEWNNQVLKDTVIWFEKESDQSLNSNAYQLASEIVQKHFPGEFGSERLVQRVVEQLLNQTRSNIVLTPMSGLLQAEEENVETEPMPATKIIMGGTGVLHKEELGVSETERNILHRIQENAELQQKRHTDEMSEKKPPSLPSTPQEIEKSSIPSDLISVAETPPKLENTDKFARVVTSDGRQDKLILAPEGTTYEMLQQWIFKTFKISPSNQRIKYGFPPQELQSSEEGAVLPLNHGDRIIVEMISDLKQSPLPTSTGIKSPPKESSFSPSNRSINDDCYQMLDILKRNNRNEMQNLFLSIAASVGDYTAWAYAKTVPHLFERGGLYFMQVDQDIGLYDGKHCNLESFPNKTFVYVAATDSLQLCVEPYGHFPVSESVDDKVGLAIQNYQSKFHNTGCSQTQTSGLRQSLGPLDFDLHSRDSEESLNLPKHNLIRKGPGYSVLSPPESSPQIQVDKLQTLANQLTNRPIHNVPSGDGERKRKSVTTSPSQAALSSQSSPSKEDQTTKLDKTDKAKAASTDNMDFI